MIDKEEMRDFIYLTLPHIGDEEFEKMWARFVAMKTKIMVKREIQ